MTELARIRNVEVARLTGNRVALAGLLGDVDALLDRLRRAGQLVAASDPVPDGRPGVYAVTVRLLPPEVHRTPAAAARPFWTPQRVGIAAGVAAGAVGLAGWAVYVALSFLAANAANVGAVLVLLALGAAVVAPRVCKTVVTVVHWH